VIPFPLISSFPRSPFWDERQRAHVKVQGYCLACLRTSPAVELNVHHKWPFHIVVQLGRPDLELDERNLYTLCEKCHLWIGHLDDWQSYNPNLLYWISLGRGLTEKQIEAMIRVQNQREKKPARFDKLSQLDRAGLRKKLDLQLPPSKEVLTTYRLTVETYK